MAHKNTGRMLRVRCNSLELHLMLRNACVKTYIYVYYHLRMSMKIVLHSRQKHNALFDIGIVESTYVLSLTQYINLNQTHLIFVKKYKMVAICIIFSLANPTFAQKIVSVNCYNFSSGKRKKRKKSHPIVAPFPS